MYNFMMALLSTTTTEVANPFTEMVRPAIDLVDMMLTPAVALVGVIGTIYCVLLGVKLAKAEEPQEHQKAKGALKNAIVGFALIFVLVAAMKMGMDPLTTWMNNAMNGDYYTDAAKDQIGTNDKYGDPTLNDT